MLFLILQWISFQKLKLTPEVMLIVGATGVETLIAGGFCCVAGARVAVKLDLFKAERPVNVFPFTTVDMEVDDDPAFALPFKSLLNTEIRKKSATQSSLC